MFILMKSGVPNKSVFESICARMEKLRNTLYIDCDMAS